MCTYTKVNLRYIDECSGQVGACLPKYLGKISRVCLVCLVHSLRAAVHKQCRWGKKIKFGNATIERHNNKERFVSLEVILGHLTIDWNINADYSREASQDPRRLLTLGTVPTFVGW